MDTATDGAKMKKKYHIDTTSLNFPKQNMEISTYMKDGMIADWEMFEQVLDYSYKKIIQSQSEYHPVLFSEAPWNKKDRREQLCELMFEKYNVPAFFLVKNAVLSAFANGRSTALVVDSGSTHTSAVPVHDGECRVVCPTISLPQISTKYRALVWLLQDTSYSTPSSSLLWARIFSPDNASSSCRTEVVELSVSLLETSVINHFICQDWRSCRPT